MKKTYLLTKEDKQGLFEKIEQIDNTDRLPQLSKDEWDRPTVRVETLTMFNRCHYEQRADRAANLKEKNSGESAIEYWINAHAFSAVRFIPSDM